jgi:hypothetical protein
VPLPAADAESFDFLGFQVVVIDGWDPDQVAVMSPARASALKLAMQNLRRYDERQHV